MRTRELFLALVPTIPFFGNVGNAASENGTIALSSLAPWGDEINASKDDIRIADEMSWLPTTRDQGDPFYAEGVDSLAASQEELKSAKSYRMEIYKAVLAALHDADFTQLKAGANNFEGAAKGAAAFAFRNAATEVALGVDGKWLAVAEIYIKGHWPCGVTKAEKLVVI